MRYSFETSIDIFKTENSYAAYFVKIINYPMTWIEVSSHSIFDKFKKATSHRSGRDNILTGSAAIRAPHKPARDSEHAHCRTGEWARHLQDQIIAVFQRNDIVDT